MKYRQNPIEGWIVNMLEFCATKGGIEILKLCQTPNGRLQKLAYVNLAALYQ
jgi:hypothetical protein